MELASTTADKQFPGALPLTLESKPHKTSEYTSVILKNYLCSLQMLGGQIQTSQGENSNESEDLDTMCQSNDAWLMYLR